MARLYPQFSACRFDSTGERRLAMRLRDKLEDDYLVWHNVPVGPKALQPDFIVLHPRRGILVLEVKDWRIDTLIDIDKTQAKIHAASGLKTTVNPMLQARDYTMTVARLLEKDPALLRGEGRFAGRLCMPYGWGVVLTKITRLQFATQGLEQVLDADRVICADEMQESADPEQFQQRLWQMFTQPFDCNLTMPQIDRVRGHLFPEIRINTGSAQFGLFDNDEALVPDLMTVMDLQQEQLARSLGEGHRVIHGVAGSGKTMILAYRCLHLAKIAVKPVLVLCFNRSLAGRLQQIIAQRGAGDKVVVMHFHGWCEQMAKTYNLSRPGQHDSFEQREQALIDILIDGVDKGWVPRAQYAGILIDEGHDFKPEWFRLIVQMLDPEHNNLLVLYDDAQSIYQAKRKAFSFSSVGIQAKGRTTILRLNYRNTAEILAVAKNFAAEILNNRDADEDSIPQIQPESVGRRGPLPILQQYPSSYAEMAGLIAALQQAHSQGHSWSEMAIIYRTKQQAQFIEKQLQREHIPFVSAVNSAARASLFTEQQQVKLVSMHSSKGLEFPVVIIPGLGMLPFAKADPVEEARLLYVAMTRSLEKLFLLSSAKSQFTEKLKLAIANGREALMAS